MDTERSLIDGRTGSVRSSRVAPICSPQNIHDQMVKDENEERGVSTNCVREVRQSYVFRNRNTNFTPPQWYALRATYGREKAAYDYLVSKGIKAFCPMQKVAKMVGGKRRFVWQSRLPNILFAFGQEDEIKTFVYDNVNLPFLRFYYCHHHEGGRLTKEPLVIPQYQIDTFKIICAAEEEDTFVSSAEIRLFERGEEVRVTQGKFAGVTGRVARFKGQKRVGIYIDGIATVATAYIPRAYLERVDHLK